jgi:tRNA modification GTPase
LQLTLHEINTIIEGLGNGLTGDFLAINIRQALFHLGSITGEVTTDTLLGNIFGKFCIGK